MIARGEVTVDDGSSRVEVIERSSKRLCSGARGAGEAFHSLHPFPRIATRTFASQLGAGPDHGVRCGGIGRRRSVEVLCRTRGCSGVCSTEPFPFKGRTALISLILHSA